jgi:hypothetical protein
MTDANHSATRQVAAREPLHSTEFREDGGITPDGDIHPQRHCYIDHWGGTLRPNVPEDRFEDPDRATGRKYHGFNVPAWRWTQLPTSGMFCFNLQFRGAAVDGCFGHACRCLERIERGRVDSVRPREHRNSGTDGSRCTHRPREATWVATRDTAAGRTRHRPNWPDTGGSPASGQAMGVADGRVASAALKSAYYMASRMKPSSSTMYAPPCRPSRYPTSHAWKDDGPAGPGPIPRSKRRTWPRVPWGPGSRSRQRRFPPLSLAKGIQAGCHQRSLMIPA